MSGSLKWLVLVLLLADSQIAFGQQVVRPYDGIQAGLDAYQLAEQQRRANVDQQLSWNDQLRFWNGFPTSRGETIYYNYFSPASGGMFGWPYASSSLLFYPPAFQAVPQPIGQQQLQTGSNRWESFPIYAPPVAAGTLPPAVSAAPAAVPAPGPVAIEPLAPRRRPREY